MVETQLRLITSPYAMPSLCVSSYVVKPIAHIFFSLAFSGACFLGRLLGIPAADSQRLTVNLDSRVWR